jgi:hypothetical protein
VNDVDLPTWIGQFEGISNSERQVPTHVPALGLEGTPVNMARVRSQAQAIRDPGPTDNVSVPVPLPPGSRAAAQPHATVRSGTSTIPTVVATYLGVWLSDLTALSHLSGQSISTPPLLGAVGQFG